MPGPCFIMDSITCYLRSCRKRDYESETWEYDIFVIWKNCWTVHFLKTEVSQAETVTTITAFKTNGILTRSRTKKEKEDLTMCQTQPPPSTIDSKCCKHSLDHSEVWCGVMHTDYRICSLQWKYYTMDTSRVTWYFTYMNVLVHLRYQFSKFD